MFKFTLPMKARGGHLECKYEQPDFGQFLLPPKFFVTLGVAEFSAEMEALIRQRQTKVIELICTDARFSATIFARMRFDEYGRSLTAVEVATASDFTDIESGKYTLRFQLRIQGKNVKDLGNIDDFVILHGTTEIKTTPPHYDVLV